jgi:hypothetical protein
MIYEDANKLEEVLAEKVREMGLGSIMTVAPTAMPTVATAISTQSDTSGAKRTVERRV